MNRNRIFYWLGMLFLGSLSIFIFSVIYQGTIPKIVEEINNGAIGAILTAIITVFLLSNQTEAEAVKEKNSIVFEKKLAIYENFLLELKSFIVEDRFADENKRRQIIELIFSLGSIQLHAKPDTVNKIFNEIDKIFTNISIEDSGKFYDEFTKSFFTILSLIQVDLYNESTKNQNLGVSEFASKINRIVVQTEKIQEVSSKSANILHQAFSKVVHEGNTNPTFPEIFEVVDRLHPGTNKDTIRAYIIRDTVNHTSRKHQKGSKADRYFYDFNTKRYRFYNSQTDGNWDAEGNKK